MSSNRIRTSRLASDAFTLIEALIATTIVSAGLIGIAGAFSLSHGAGTRADRLREAAMLAERRLELATAVSADQLDADKGSSGRLAWQVTYSERHHNLMMASVSIRWLDRGRPTTFHLSRVFQPRQ